MVFELKFYIFICIYIYIIYLYLFLTLVDSLFMRRARIKSLIHKHIVDKVQESDDPDANKVHHDI